MFFTRAWIVRLERNIEQVFAIHAGMHHKLGGDGGALTRLECRRTDDGAGRSAPLHDSDGRGGIERQRAITDIRDFEFGAYHLVERLPA